MSNLCLYKPNPRRPVGEGRGVVKSSKPLSIILIFALFPIIRSNAGINSLYKSRAAEFHLYVAI